jgi:DNA repair protein RadC
LTATNLTTRYRLSLVREATAPYGEDPERLSGAVKVARFLTRLLEDEPAECVGVVLLDSKNHPTGHLILFRGTINRVAVEARQVFAAALLANAAAVILFHNHPSGDVDPSAEDILFTRNVTAAGEVLGIHLHDHLIVAGSKWASLRERGLL